MNSDCPSELTHGAATPGLAAGSPAPVTPEEDEEYDLPRSPDEEVGTTRQAVCKVVTSRSGKSYLWHPGLKQARWLPVGTVYDVFVHHTGDEYCSSEELPHNDDTLVLWASLLRVILLLVCLFVC